MKKIKDYKGCKFSIEVLKRVYDSFLDLTKVDEGEREYANTYRVKNDTETWYYDTIEEFLSAQNEATSCWLRLQTSSPRAILEVTEISYPGNYSTEVSVKFDERHKIETIFSIFESNAEKCRIETQKVVETNEEEIKIFIGHGHDDQWRGLKDHLHEQHGFEVVSYEIGPRAGTSVKDVLENMMEESSFALLILTGEDTDSEGVAHARENVIHELGLFQGRLGFKRAIAVLERDVHEFSNILGVNQLRFSNGNIREIFGDVIATINREFNR